MSKAAGFEQDLAVIQAEMQNVSRIIEASRAQPAEKVIEIDATRSSQVPRASTSRPRPARSTPARPASAVNPVRGRANVTTRLSAETNELLTEAALKQKLKRARPDTRQDIIEVALTDWLKRHGYDRKQRTTRGSDQEPNPSLQCEDQAECEAEFPLETFPKS